MTNTWAIQLFTDTLIKNCMLFFHLCPGLVNVAFIFKERSWLIVGLEYPTFPWDAETTASLLKITSDIFSLLVFRSRVITSTRKLRQKYLENNYKYLPINGYIVDCQPSNDPK